MDYNEMSLGEVAKLVGKKKSTVQGWHNSKKKTFNEKVEEALGLVDPTPSSTEKPISKKSEPVKKKEIKFMEITPEVKKKLLKAKGMSWLIN